MEWTLEFINASAWVPARLLHFIFHFTLYQTLKNWYNISALNSTTKRTNEWNSNEVAHSDGEVNGIASPDKQTKDKRHIKNKKIMQIKSEAPSAEAGYLKIPSYPLLPGPIKWVVFGLRAELM